jgi:hypothetical protein
MRHRPTESVNRKPIEQVLRENAAHWMTLPGVVGTAIGLHQDKPCIMVLVAQRADELAKTIPTSVEGYPVVIEVTGEIKALNRP